MRGRDGEYRMDELMKCRAEAARFARDRKEDYVVIGHAESSILEVMSAAEANELGYTYGDQLHYVEYRREPR